MEEKLKIQKKKISKNLNYKILFFVRRKNVGFDKTKNSKIFMKRQKLNSEGQTERTLAAEKMKRVIDKI